MASAVFDSSAQTMKQATIRGVDDVRLDSVPIPLCGDRDMVVEVRCCGICGSDLGYIAMGGLLGPGQPMPIGHEFSAVVSETGSLVTTFSVGDRVVVNPMAVEPAIGNAGPEGAFAPYLLVRDVVATPDAAFAIPDGLGMEQAAMVEPLAVAMHAVHRGEVSVSDSVVVFGAGTIGLSIALVLRYYGVKHVVVIDRCESRLQLAEAIGATPIVAGSVADTASLLRELHGTKQHFGRDVPASDLYFEATGVGAVFDDIVGLACEQARVVVVGVHKQPVTLDLVTLLSKELSVIGSIGYPTEFPQVIDMLEHIDFDPALLISHRFPLSAFDQALRTAGDTDASIKVMVDCQH